MVAKKVNLMKYSEWKQMLKQNELNSVRLIEKANPPISSTNEHANVNVLSRKQLKLRISQLLLYSSLLKRLNMTFFSCNFFLTSEFKCSKTVVIVIIQMYSVFHFLSTFLG